MRTKKRVISWDTFVKRGGLKGDRKKGEGRKAQTAKIINFPKKSEPEPKKEEPLSNREIEFILAGGGIPTNDPCLVDL